MKYRGQEGVLQGGDGPNPDKTDDVMLVRSRLSRIYYGFLEYLIPNSLSISTPRIFVIWSFHFRISKSELFSVTAPQG